MVSSWHQIICSQRTVGPLLFHFDNNTRSVPHFNQSRARPSRRHHLFSFECGGGWIKTLAQWQNARLKYFNFPEDKLENWSRRRCCLCFLNPDCLCGRVLLTPQVDESERASEQVSERVSSGESSECSIISLSSSIHCTTAPLLVMMTMMMTLKLPLLNIWLRERVRAPCCSLQYYILHYCPGQATIPLYLSGLAQSEVLCVPV